MACRQFAPEAACASLGPPRSAYGAELRQYQQNYACPAALSTHLAMQARWNRKIIDTMKYVPVALLCCLQGLAVSAQQPRTEITKWQDGKLAALSLTYDDSTINQFRIAVPMMNERGLPATFFVITGQIPGSMYLPTFVGRPIMEIVRESATVPTNKANALERSSMLRYLGEVQRVEIVLEKFRPKIDPIWLVYPQTRHLSPKVRAFIDFVVSRFR